MPEPIGAATRAAMLAARPRSLAVGRGWRDGAAYRRIEAAFAGLDEAEAIAGAAEALLAHDAWVGELLAPLVAAARADAFFEPPLKVNRDSLRTGAILFESAAVTLTATVLDAAVAAALPEPETLVVPGRIGVTRYVRGGGATLRRWRVEAAGPDFSAPTAAHCVALPGAPISDGEVRRIDGRTTGHLLRGARRDMVIITATIRAGQGPFMREYRIADGALLRLAPLDDRAARTSMLLALLRHSGRPDAAAYFDRASRDPAFFVRWDAMREWLALDARGALPRLEEMAEDDANAEVRQAARSTLAMVRERMAEAACPA